MPTARTPSRVVWGYASRNASKFVLNEPLQSAYTPNHSTETAVVKVVNDIHLALDSGQCVFLVLLDLSAAFDTIDHEVYLSRLKENYGVTGEVADWMESYLVDRHQIVDINDIFSDKIKLKYGFPQGSKIGPFGFKMYTKPLVQIAHKHNIAYICMLMTHNYIPHSTPKIAQMP